MTTHNTTYSTISVIKPYGSKYRLDREFTSEIDNHIILSLQNGKTLCLRDEDQNVTSYKVISCEYHSWNESALLIVNQIESHSEFLDKLTKGFTLKRK